MLKRIIINKKRPWLTDLLTILISTVRLETSVVGCLVPKLEFRRCHRAPKVWSVFVCVEGCNQDWLIWTRGSRILSPSCPMRWIFWQEMGRHLIDFSGRRLDQKSLNVMLKKQLQCKKVEELRRGQNERGSDIEAIV